jgi:hypothetical protein
MATGGRVAKSYAIRAVHFLRLLLRRIVAARAGGPKIASRDFERRVGISSCGANDSLLADLEMEVRRQRAVREPLESTEPSSASLTNSDSETPPTASPLHRLARGSCASRFPELSGLIHGPGVRIRLEVERR